MEISEPDLGKLIDLETRYFAFLANLTRTESAWYLNGPEVPDFWDANRALRLRDDGRGPNEVAKETVARLRGAGLRPVVDVDPIARRQGFENALTDLGFHAAPYDWLLMRASASSIVEPSPRIDVRYIDSDSREELRTWVEIAVSDLAGNPGEELWRAVAERESRFPGFRHYVANLDGRPVAVCDLFSAGGWGRIESVATLPEFRRRGAGSAVVARALADSIEEGNETTFLFTESGSAAERVYRRLGFTPWVVNALHRYTAR